MVQIFRTRNSSIVILRPPKNTNSNDERLRTPNEPKMHDNGKTCFAFQTARLCPNNWATNDDRHMRMTDKDTPHAPKIMLTSIGLRQKGQETLQSRIATTGLIGLDNVRTTHNISSVIFPSLRLLHLLMWSQVTFVRFTVHFSRRQLSIFVHD